MPRAIALWITLRGGSRAVRGPKLLQPRPTAETRRPEPPRLRICMGWSCEGGMARDGIALWRARQIAARWRPGARRDAAGYSAKRCGPGQTRRLTGTAGARDL